MAFKEDKPKASIHLPSACDSNLTHPPILGLANHPGGPTVIKSCTTRTKTGTLPSQVLPWSGSEGVSQPALFREQAPLVPNTLNTERERLLERNERWVQNSFHIFFTAQVSSSARGRKAMYQNIIAPRLMTLHTVLHYATMHRRRHGHSHTYIHSTYICMATSEQPNGLGSGSVILNRGQHQLGMDSRGVVSVDLVRKSQSLQCQVCRLLARHHHGSEGRSLHQPIPSIPLEIYPQTKHNTQHPSATKARPSQTSSKLLIHWDGILHPLHGQRA